MKRWILTAALGALFVPVAAEAQPRASERGAVRQTVNGTTVTLDFSRPVARGRTELFGGVVHWGEMWTPGANYATTFEVDRPIELNGHAVEPGLYSVWMEPQPDDWTFHLHEDPGLYHDSPVPEDGFVLSFTVRPQQGTHMEALAWYFPVIGPESAELRMHWGTTYVPLTVKTETFEVPEVANVARYAGTYAMAGSDPTTGGPFEVEITVLEEGGNVAGRWGTVPIALVHVGGGEFRIGFLRNGALFDVGDEMTFRVVVEGGEGVRAQMRWEGEHVWATGERVR